jgi:hypothetical protein
MEIRDPARKTAWNAANRGIQLCQRAFQSAEMIKIIDDEGDTERRVLNLAENGIDQVYSTRLDGARLEHANRRQRG